MNLSHNLSGITVGQRVSDGYINATALTTAHKQATGKRKDVADWLKTKRTQETLEHLGSVTNLSVTALYQVIQGGIPENQGTWLHPKLSVRFAMWLSDDFGFQVESWIEQWMTEAKNPIAHQVQTVTPELPVVMPTQQELDYMRSRTWEKAEMKGLPVSTEVIKHKTGFKRASDVVSRFQEQAEQRAIEGGDE